MDKKDKHFSLDSSPPWLPAGQVGDREREGAIYSSPVKDASFNSSPFPKQLQTVKVNGEVLYSVTTRYNANRGFKYYISQGGGFSNKSLKRRSYVIYANGSVKSTSKIFLFNSYPQVSPGAEIFVPKKLDKKPLSAAEILGISSGLALAVIILNLVKL